MNKQITISAVALAAIGVAVTWVIIRREDPQLQEIRRLQGEIQQSVESPNGEQPDNQEDRDKVRREKMAEYWEKVGALPEEQRKSVQSQMRNYFITRMEQRIDRVLELPPEKRNAELDKQIDESDARRRRWQQQEQAETKSAEVSGTTSQASSSTTDDKQAEADKQQTNKSSTRRHGHWRNASLEQRNEWRRRLLANTTPEQRAKWQEYRRLVNQRRKERNLPERRGPF